MTPSRYNLYKALSLPVEVSLGTERFHELSDRLWARDLAEICGFIYLYE